MKIMNLNIKNVNKLNAYERIEMIADKDSFIEWHADCKNRIHIDFDGYDEKIKKAKEETGLNDAVVIGCCKIHKENVVLIVCDYRFLIGTIGYVMGENITFAFEKAIEKGLPVFMFCCSGGGRMQEGVVSLMQVNKINCIIRKFQDTGLFYCSIITNPTYGAAFISFAILGDIVIAEKGSYMGLAGQRVIKNTIGEDLPKNFQSDEYFLNNGMIDMILDRNEIRDKLYLLIKAHKKTNLKKICILKRINCNNKILEVNKDRTNWDKIQILRNSNRPDNIEYINLIFDEYLELHGDKISEDDNAILGGIGFIEEQPVTIINTHMGKSINERIKTHFGMSMSGGFRKALRLMKQAEKFRRPIICFVNMIGAFPGIEAEENGIAISIAECIKEMSAIKVPILSILTGECNSGGALALSMANEIWMMENAIYSLISPEGMVSILKEDTKNISQICNEMKISAKDMLKFNIIDKIIPEYGIANDDTKKKIALNIKNSICSFINRYKNFGENLIIEQRYSRYRKF